MIIDGESLNSLDSSAIFVLNEIYSYFKDKHVQMAFTGLKGPVRDIMIKSGLMEKIGHEFFFMSIQEAVDYYEGGFKKGSKFDKYINQANQ